MDLSAVRIFVRELAPAKKFYSEVLGLRLAGGDDEQGYWAFTSNGVSIILETVSAGSDPEDAALVGRMTGLSFSVSDIDAECERMSGQGVTFFGAPEKQFWGGWLATFADPSGNRLQLVQYSR
jgi:predicted enzyme related to lactoylglutathione lyase